MVRINLVLEKMQFIENNSDECNGGEIRDHPINVAISFSE
jgi:hypothetical protein